MRTNAVSRPAPRILKFDLPLAGERTIQTGGIRRVLGVGFQMRRVPTLGVEAHTTRLVPVIWVEAEPEGSDERRYAVVMTGEPAPEGAHVGSAQWDPAGNDVGPYVIHVYDVTGN